MNGDQPADAVLADIDIEGLTADSRQVRPGYLFAALPGSRADGRSFIADAIGRGARAVLAPAGIALDSPVPVIADSNPRRRLARMAARFYGQQPAHVAAVTGTNGKTSVVDFTRQIWSHLGLKAASVGTLGVIAPDLPSTKGLTTPDPVELHRVLASLAGSGVGFLSMEASSHGLDQYRLDGVRVTAAAFTNLARDHLDYHPDMDAYFQAKTRLFDRVMLPGGTAVLNADIPQFAALSRVCARRDHKIVSYGRAAGADLRLVDRLPRSDGQRLGLILNGKAREIELPLAGGFQAMNALAALGLVLASGIALNDALPALESLTGVAGRLERIASLPGGSAIYVDYAHKPGALETVLTEIRPFVERRLWVVFGCGGDRDRGKRPMMGEIAARLAEMVIVTDDNPRSEDPAAIRAEVMQGCPEATEIGDREEAIRAAIAGLEPGDVLVIAGKGHEQGQEIKGETRPFDDAAVARAAARERGAA
ncbi:UDP-N-acetylmuramoyl-L-alanyl-D-glutamate--2,6-diaminopimelate ligase [Oceanibaculum pacificum]|uniref:UDP-N-acetylmuramoyl-L-alanyl-D-glutamate--2,6-diaminopimelate ligase n=1 Tax=Oceanibaculum pacificum TaxID=580166 RepID=A0A154W0H3_9PROT|nr:UDP-N-acetylmuramoyl-L-alanyl-D-glutamate--2,6-diaminopimelate ligase [Oceanibaculum pacificum]